MSQEATNSCSPFTGSEYAAVGGLYAASGFISLLASCFVLFLIVLFKRWKFFTQRMVLYLAASVAFQSVAAIIARVDYNNETTEFYVRFCEFSAFVGQNASWSVLMAVASITVYVFVLSVFSKRTDRLEIGYVLFTFVLPLLFNWIPFIERTYGKAGAWCWIRNQDDMCNTTAFGVVLQFVLWYVPLYVILCILIGLYVTILVKVHCFSRNRWIVDYKHEEENRNKQLSREIRWLLWYPLIYFIINLFPLCLRIHGLAAPRNPNLGLWILTAIFLPLQGLLNAIVFALDVDTRKKLKWVHLRAAAGEFCRSSDDDIIEYPVQHISSTTEYNKGISSGVFTNEYHIIHDNGNQDK